MSKTQKRNDASERQSTQTEWDVAMAHLEDVILPEGASARVEERWDAEKMALVERDEDGNPIAAISAEEPRTNRR